MKIRRTDSEASDTPRSITLSLWELSVISYVLLSKTDTQRTNNLLGISKLLKGLGVAMHSWHGGRRIRSLKPALWISWKPAMCDMPETNNKKRSDRDKMWSSVLFGSVPNFFHLLLWGSLQDFSFLLALWDSVFLYVPDCLEQSGLELTGIHWPLPPTMPGQTFSPPFSYSWNYPFFQMWWCCH